MVTAEESLRPDSSDADGSETNFTVTVRVDTPREVEYYRHGGILPYVLRELAK